MPPDLTPSPLAGVRTRLTARGWGLLGLSLGTAVLGVLLPEAGAIQLGLFGGVLLLGTWPVARRNLNGLRVTWDLPVSAFAGQLFPCTLTLHNDSRWSARAVEVEDSLAGPAERGMDAAVVAGGSGSQRVFETRVLRRGLRHSTRTQLRSTFPLGLWECRRGLRGRVDLTIFPRPVPPRHLTDAPEAAMVEAGEEESQRRDWSGDFHGIRPFQPGDRVKRIHWPATARAGRLMVREFDQRLPRNCRIIFHSIHPHPERRRGPDAFEGGLELLCGLVLRCVDQGIPLDLTLAGEGWRTWPVRHPAALEAVLECLAATRRAADQDMAALHGVLGGVEAGAQVFLVSDVPVKDWEGLLPDLPFAVVCLSVTDLRVRQPGLRQRAALPA